MQTRKRKRRTTATEHYPLQALCLPVSSPNSGTNQGAKCVVDVPFREVPFREVQCSLVRIHYCFIQNMSGEIVSPPAAAAAAKRGNNHNHPQQQPPPPPAAATSTRPPPHLDAVPKQLTGTFLSSTDPTVRTCRLGNPADGMMESAGSSGRKHSPGSMEKGTTLPAAAAADPVTPHGKRAHQGERPGAQTKR